MLRSIIKNVKQLSNQHNYWLISNVIKHSFESYVKYRFPIWKSQIFLATALKPVSLGGGGGGGGGGANDQPPPP